MRQVSRRQKLIVDLNITPLTDIALTLLIILMVTTPFISELGIKVKLPYVQSNHPLETTGSVPKAQITVTAEGMIYLDGKLVTRRELKEKIGLLYRSNPDIGIVLRADRLVRFKDIVGILDPLSDLGITSFDIACVGAED